MNRGVLVAQGTLAQLRSISQLPIRISLDLSPGAIEVPTWMRGESLATPHGRVVLVRDDAKKMELLRDAAGDARVRNIEIAAPTLDDLYAHFLRTQEAAA